MDVTDVADVTENEPAVDVGWCRQFGGTDVWARAMAASQEGDFAIAGSFDGDTLDLGGAQLSNAGSTSMFVARFDRLGNHLWSRSSEAKSGGGMSTANTVQVDSSGRVMVAGTFHYDVSFGGEVHSSVGHGDAFVATFGPSGEFVSSIPFLSSGSQAWDGRQEAIGAKLDSNGNTVVAVACQGAMEVAGIVLPDTGSWDLCLVKLNPSLAVVWAKRWTHAHSTVLNPIALDAEDNVIVTGGFYGALDFGQGPVAEADSKGLYVAKLDPGGGMLWSHVFDTGCGELAGVLAVEPSGNVLLAGGVTCPVDFGAGEVGDVDPDSDVYLAQFEADGSLAWANVIDGFDDQWINSASLTPVGALLVAGVNDVRVDLGGGPLFGDNEPFVALFSNAGQHLGSRQFHGHATIAGMAALPGGGVALLIGADEAVDFGEGPLTAELALCSLPDVWK